MKFINPISVDESSDYFIEAVLHFQSGKYYEKGKMNYSFPNIFCYASVCFENVKWYLIILTLVGRL